MAPLASCSLFQGAGDNEDGYYDYEYKFDPESGGESDPDSDYEMTQSFYSRFLVYGVLAII
jgi:hypothetical protein